MKLVQLGKRSLNAGKSEDSHQLCPARVDGDRSGRSAQDGSRIHIGFDLVTGRIAVNNIRTGSVRSEQRSLAEKELPPGGLRRIWPLAALLVGYRPSTSRLATGQIGRNERDRIYEMDHLGVKLASSKARIYSFPFRSTLKLVGD